MIGLALAFEAMKIRSHKDLGLQLTLERKRGDGVLSLIQIGGIDGSRNNKYI